MSSHVAGETNAALFALFVLSAEFADTAPTMVNNGGAHKARKSHIVSPDDKLKSRGKNFLRREPVCQNLITNCSRNHNVPDCSDLPNEVL